MHRSQHMAPLTAFDMRRNPISGPCDHPLHPLHGPSVCTHCPAGFCNLHGCFSAVQACVCWPSLAGGRGGCPLVSLGSDGKLDHPAHGVVAAPLLTALEVGRWLGVASSSSQLARLVGTTPVAALYPFRCGARLWCMQRACSWPCWRCRCCAVCQQLQRASPDHVVHTRPLNW